MGGYLLLLPWFAAGGALLYGLGGTAYVLFYLASLLFMAWRFHLYSAWLQLAVTGPHPLSAAAHAWQAPAATVCEAVRARRNILARQVFAMMVGGMVLGGICSFPTLSGGFRALVDPIGSATSPMVIRKELFVQVGAEDQYQPTITPILPTRPIDTYMPKNHLVWPVLALCALCALAVGFFDVWADTTANASARERATLWRGRTAWAFLVLLVAGAAFWLDIFRNFGDNVVYLIGIGIVYWIMKRTW